MVRTSNKAKTGRKSTTEKTRRTATKAQTSTSRQETTRDILFTKFPRVHSNEEVLATQRTRNFGPPLTQLTPIGSKRSRRLTANVSDQEGTPLDNTLISWQGAMPGYHTMHLADHLRRKKLVFIGNLLTFFADSIMPLGGLDVKILDGHNFSFDSRKRHLGVYEETTGPDHAVETVADLEGAELYREQLIAACSSAAIATPGYFADSVGLLAWTDDTPTLQPGAEGAKATGYISLDHGLPGVSLSTKLANEVGYDAIEYFGLSALQPISVQSICAPVNVGFPLSAVERVAQLEMPLEPFVCQGRDDPAHFCRSSQCRGKVSEFLHPFTRAGRPTGVDGDPVLELIRRAERSDVPVLVEPPTHEEIVTAALFVDQAWDVLVGSDSTVGTFTGVNEQMTVIRHRDSGTMILSGVQKVYREPITSGPSHLAVQIGQNVFAHNDALSRAVKLDEHMRSGTLPASFRFPYRNEINLLQSNLSFKELSRAYEVSVGKFLPPVLSDPEYTFARVSGLFENAPAIRINWDEDDASMLHFIFGDFKSPMTLPAVRASSSSTASILDVKIHCFKQHSRRVFLCHLIDADKEPYGKPLVMKLAWSPILGENEEVLELLRIVRTDEINHEFEILQQLADGDADVACRVPKPYGQFSGEVIIEHLYRFSAYFVEDCEGCYPIGIADDLNRELCRSISVWLESVHDRDHLLHGNLSTENILFKPSDPTCFYVVGWQKASPVAAGFESLPLIEPEETLLQSLFVKKDHASGPPKKQGGYETEDEDEDTLSESLSGDDEP